MKRPGRKGLTLGALLAVVGPGLLAGLSDDDPAGITTYSVLGADYGYQLLWVLLLSTVALVLFHDLAHAWVWSPGRVSSVSSAAVRRAAGRCCAGRARGRQRRHHLRRVRRDRRRLRAVRESAATPASPPRR